MAKAFISYYEHLAKLAQVANKQTMFLAHMLSNMEFDRGSKQYIVDMSTVRKINIMQEVSPEVPKDRALANANQYLNKLSKVGLVRSAGHGAWVVDPMCYGQNAIVSGQLRKENKKIFATYEFTLGKRAPSVTTRCED